MRFLYSTALHIDENIMHIKTIGRGILFTNKIILCAESVSPSRKSATHASTLITFWCSVKSTRVTVF